MKLLFHAVAASVTIWTHCLDLKQIRGVRVEVVYLDRAFLQNQNLVGGDVSGAVAVLRGKSESGLAKNSLEDLTQWPQPDQTQKSWVLPFGGT